MSILYTPFGLARIERAYDKGTWMRLNMLLDVDATERNNPYAISPFHLYIKYAVTKATKIGPPMFTRIITRKGVKRFFVYFVLNFIISNPNRKIKCNNKA